MHSDFLSSYADNGLYLMQGRLSPPENGRFQSFPRQNWRQEIALIPQAGLRGIEWIYDLYGQSFNPLETAEGRAEMRQQLTRHHVSVVSVCADYFMDCPLIRCSLSERTARLARLVWLIGICPELGISRIVLPFVDASSIKTMAEQTEVIAALQQVLPVAESCQVELHLETDLSPEKFRQLLQAIPHPLIQVNYDAGNSAAWGYDPAEEFKAYGAKIGSFHIKDRVFKGGTVPLGTGNTDFSALRQALIKTNYQGDFVLQVARGNPGDELNWIQQVTHSAQSWLRGNTTAFSR